MSDVKSGIDRLEEPFQYEVRVDVPNLGGCREFFQPYWRASFQEKVGDVKKKKKL